MTGRKKDLIIVGVSVISLCLLVAGYVGFVLYFAQPVRIQGRAMEPGLRDGDRIFINKQFGTLNRSDIIIFYYPADPARSYIKRVVGLPGEQIEVRGGKVLINDKLLEEPYVDQKLNLVQVNLPPVQIPPQSFYVMGDNRDNSSDSRFWGALHEKYIYGRFLSKY